MSAALAVADLKKMVNPKKRNDLQRFFKTGPGEYAEGDLFLGVMVPQTRTVAAKYKDISLAEIGKLTSSEYHEVRLCGVIILTLQFKSTSDEKVQKKIFDFYIKELKAGNINNWDLVDVSAPTIGQYLLNSESPTEFLRKLARSKSLWQRRASIIFTFAFFRVGIFEPSLEMADELLYDKHDLIHKAVGWTLREVGNRDPRLLRSYLQANAATMPRTALRYSIEKLPAQERKKWLAAKTG
jgi:3-methyladenine DNA glycosylase AlkD